MRLFSVALRVNPRPAVTDCLSDIVRRHLAAPVRDCRRPLRGSEPTIPLGMLGSARDVPRCPVMYLGAHGGGLRDGIRCPRQSLEVLGGLAGGFGHPVAYWPFLALLHGAIVQHWRTGLHRFLPYVGARLSMS